MRADVVHRNNRGAGWGAASPTCVSSDGASGWVMSLSGRCRSQNVPEKIGWKRAGNRESNWCVRVRARAGNLNGRKRLGPDETWKKCGETRGW